MAEKLSLKGLFVPANMPQVAWAETSNGLGVNRTFNATQDLDTVRRIRRAYYAAVSYIDDSIGRVLAVLDELGHSGDTLVVLTSDHSIAMGEQGTWGKMTNFESTLKVPLIMRAPWVEASVGKTTSVLAELVDLYATLTDLAGLPEPASVGESINGTSLARAFSHPDEVLIKTSALSQLAKPNLSEPNERTLTVQRNELEVMGYSLRKQLYRYTAWFKFNGNKSIARTRQPIGRELYTYDELGEGENLVDKPLYAEIVESMHTELLQLISSEPMTANQTVMPVLNE
jgi:iduronate 2-sulfatase